jgi:hypothetical protein
MPRETHEEVKETQEGAKPDKGVFPDQIFKPDGDDDANEGGQAQSGESK